MKSFKRIPLILPLFFIGISTAFSQNAEIVKDINPNGSSIPNLFSMQVYPMNDSMYFNASDGSTGLELWKTKSTEQSTKLIKDLSPGADSTRFTEGGLYNGTFYFGADTGTNNMELWETDGTARGTQLLKDINPNGSSNPDDFIRVNNMMLFTASNDTHGTELWRTDGTIAGTKMIKDIDTNSMASSNPREFLKFKGNVYFTAETDTHGRELWRSDGTEAGTEIVKDIVTGPVGSSPSVYSSSDTINGYFFFTADNDTDGTELWRSDGTKVGTKMVADINSGTASGVNFSTAAGEVVGNYFYFAADSGNTGYELWETDGTATNTQMVKNINGADSTSLGAFFNSTFISHNGQLYFAASQPSTGLELWTSDGTSSGTKLVKDIHTGKDSSDPLLLLSNQSKIGGYYYFIASDSAHGAEIWRSDGTTGGSHRVTDLYSGPYPSVRLIYHAINNYILFYGIDGSRGLEPYRIDPATVDRILESQQKETPLSVYPNPADRYFNLKFTEKQAQDGKVKLRNIAGKVVKEWSQVDLTSHQRLSLPDVSTGTYLLEVHTSKQVYGHRLIIN